MSTKTKIEWAELSWNPVTGCSKISPGCQNCYAETMARRLQGMGVNGYENGFSVTLHPSRLCEPLIRKKPSLYFVNSMSDLFHEEIPDRYIERILSVINNASAHTFQILTKRAERMASFCKKHLLPQNAWLGVTIENQSHGLPRLDLLRNIDASVRFVSMEPLLEDIGPVDLTRIDWVIVGGESGTRGRPMATEWVLNIKRQCEEQGVEFFFKQWGSIGSDGVRRSKKANGRLLLGRTWDNKPFSMSAAEAVA